jgi:hypothetical protein
VCETASAAISSGVVDGRSAVHAGAAFEDPDTPGISG